MDNLSAPPGRNPKPSQNFRKRASILSVCVLTSAGVFLSPSVAFAAEVGFPVAATSYDECGTANDRVWIEDSVSGVSWYRVDGANRIEVGQGFHPTGGMTTEFIAQPTNPEDTFPDGSTEQSYVFTFTDQSCDIMVHPNHPRFDDFVGTENDTVTIPFTEGVIYVMNGVAVAEGVYAGSGEVIVEATAAEGYQMDPAFQSVFTYTFDAGDVIAVSAIPPEFNDVSGSAEDTVTIPTKGGVQYFMNSVAVEAGIYPAEGEVIVEAVAKEGYTLEPGSDAIFVHSFDPTSHETVVTAAPPEFNDVSGAADDVIVIPVTEGVNYTLNGEAVVAGEYPGVGTVTVVANAAPGYSLDPAVENTWEFVFDTDVVVTPAEPVFTDVNGTEWDTVTIPEVGGVDYTLNGEAVVAGEYPGVGTVVVGAVAEEGFEFAPGTTTEWANTFETGSVITPVYPFFTDESGTADDTVMIPAAEGIDYFLNGELVTNGDYPGVGTVTVEAVAQEGYEFPADAVSAWNFTFSDEVEPVVIITPAEPTFVDEAGTNNDIVDIPVAEGVNYLLNGELVMPGEYAGVGDVTVEAVAADGYALEADATVIWNFTFTDEVEPVVLAPASPVFSDKNGAANDTITIPDTEGVTYLLNGEPVAPGTHVVRGNVTIQAVAAEGYEFGAGAVTTWTETFDSTMSVTPQQPAINGNILTIPDVEGIQYFLNGEAVGPGEYTLTGNAVVTAEALEGYSIPAGAIVGWNVVEEDGDTPPITPITTPILEAETPNLIPTPGVITPAVSTGVFGEEVFIEDTYYDDGLADTGASPALFGLLGAGGLLTALGAGLTRFGRNKKA